MKADGRCGMRDAGCAIRDVIRERFRLKGQVKAASAHGRLTATILTLLPIATMQVSPGQQSALTVHLPQVGTQGAS